MKEKFNNTIVETNTMSHFSHGLMQSKKSTLIRQKISPYFYL